MKFNKYNNRIGNLEVRNNHNNKPLFNLSGDESYSTFELIKWTTNEHYGKYDEYIEDGYELSFLGGFIRKNNISIDINCFKNPESCFVIGFFRLNYNEPEAIWLELIIDRYIDLSEEELLVFKKILEQSTEYIINYINKNKND
jgi:hypothetical protein